MSSDLLTLVELPLTALTKDPCASPSTGTEQAPEVLCELALTKWATNRQLESSLIL